MLFSLIMKILHISSILNSPVILMKKIFLLLTWHTPLSSKIPNPPPLEIIFFSHGKITKIVKTLNTKTSPRPDGLSNCFVRILHHCHPTFLTSLFNVYVSLSYFSGSWKHGHVIMIPKYDQDPCSSKAYRPITLLPELSKFFEKLILAIKPSPTLKLLLSILISSVSVKPYLQRSVLTKLSLTSHPYEWKIRSRHLSWHKGNIWLCLVTTLSSTPLES